MVRSLNQLLDKFSFLGLLFLGVFVSVVAIGALAPEAASNEASSGALQATLLTQVPWLASWPMATVSFAIGTFSLAYHRRFRKAEIAALGTVGFAIAFATSGLWYGLLSGGSGQFAGLPAVGFVQLLGLWVFEIVILGIVQFGLRKLTSSSGNRFYRASESWRIVLTVGLLLWGSGLALITLIWPTEAFTSYLVDVQSMQVAMVAVFAITTAALRFQPTDWHYWILAWAVEVILIIEMAMQGMGVAAIGIATLAVALCAQIMGDLWVLRNGSFRESWHDIPLAYAVTGALLGHAQLQADGGLFTLVAGLVFIGVGRRQQTLNIFSYAGFAAISMGAAELLLYRLLNVDGGQMGDRIVLFAVIPLGLALIEKVLSPWLLRYLRISLRGLHWVAHTHWATGSLIAAIAPLFGLSAPHALTIWLMTVLLLSGYALDIGYRRWTPHTFAGPHLLWTFLGLLQLLGGLMYGLIRLILFA